jgi:hypothetical protein
VQEVEEVGHDGRAGGLGRAGRGLLEGPRASVGSEHQRLAVEDEVAAGLDDVEDDVDNMQDEVDGEPDDGGTDE